METVKIFIYLWKLFRIHSLSSHSGDQGMVRGSFRGDLKELIKQRSPSWGMRSYQDTPWPNSSLWLLPTAGCQVGSDETDKKGTRVIKRISRLCVDWPRSTGAILLSFFGSTDESWKDQENKPTLSVSDLRAGATSEILVSLIMGQFFTALGLLELDGLHLSRKDKSILAHVLQSWLKRFLTRFEREREWNQILQK